MIAASSDRKVHNPSNELDVHTARRYCMFHMASGWCSIVHCILHTGSHGSDVV